jgi:hypothetical protein
MILKDDWTGVIVISPYKNATKYMCDFMTGRIREATHSTKDHDDFCSGIPWRCICSYLGTLGFGSTFYALIDVKARILWGMSGGKEGGYPRLR